jgi:hypothetical protein
MQQRPTIYANAFEVTFSPTEVLIDLKLRAKAKGRPSEEGRVILSHEVAAKLGIALYPPDEEAENVTENTSVEKSND